MSHLIKLRIFFSCKQFRYLQFNFPRNSFIPCKNEYVYLMPSHDLNWKSIFEHFFFSSTSFKIYMRINCWALAKMFWKKVNGIFPFSLQNTASFVYRTLSVQIGCAIEYFQRNGWWLCYSFRFTYQSNGQAMTFKMSKHIFSCQTRIGLEVTYCDIKIIIKIWLRYHGDFLSVV